MIPVQSRHPTRLLRTVQQRLSRFGERKTIRLQASMRLLALIVGSQTLQRVFAHGFQHDKAPVLCRSMAGAEQTAIEQYSKSVLDTFRSTEFWWSDSHCNLGGEGSSEHAERPKENLRFEGEQI